MMKRVHNIRGFTLVEMVMVIVIIGIVSGMVAIFMRAPVQGYFDTVSRAGLTDAADTALRRIGRDVRLALPNSVSVSADNKTLSFLQTRMGGRYRAQPTAGGLGNPLQPGEEAVTEFDVLGDITQGGTLAAPQAGEWVVVYNLGIPGADADESGADSNRASVGAGSTGTAIQLAASKRFPLASPGNRFHVVEARVTYACQNGTLTRTWQSPPDAAASSAILAADADCNATVFKYDENMVNQRWGLVAMILALSKNNETVTLYHEAHVSNVP